MDYDYMPYCFVCSRPTEHMGEHDAIVDAGMAEYDYENGFVSKTELFDADKAQQLAAQEYEEYMKSL